jgi:hypothetical protein
VDREVLHITTLLQCFWYRFPPKRYIMKHLEQQFNPNLLFYIHIFFWHAPCTVISILEEEHVMKKLSETLKQMLDALACADAGEYLTRRGKSRVLSQRSGVIQKTPYITEPTQTDADSNARRVALYLGSELPPEVMDYLVQTCARLRHQLTVLTFETENTARALLEPHQKALDDAGVDMKLVSLAGDPVPGLARYLRRHPEVAFLACKDLGYLGRSYLNGTPRENALPVPVVIVTSKSGAAEKPLQPAADPNSGTSATA